MYQQRDGSMGVMGDIACSDGTCGVGSPWYVGAMGNMEQCQGWEKFGNTVCLIKHWDLGNN